MRAVAKSYLLAFAGSAWLFLAAPLTCPADEPGNADVTNTFPSVAEVIGGHTFETFTDQDIFFLRSIHDRYHDHWPDLLAANITVKEYALSPDKLLRFINELGDAMRDQNDPDACTNLGLVVGDAAFYADPNVYRPEILRAAAQALIKIGPEGRKTLAAAISESHYRADPGSLEDVADAIGVAKPQDPALVQALSAAAFDFSTTNGAYYPKCTTAAVKNLLSMAGGSSAVQAHLKTPEILANPGRFQAVMDGIAAARMVALATNLVAIQAEIQPKLAALTNSPGGYRDDLQELENRIGQTLAEVKKNSQN